VRKPSSRAVDLSAHVVGVVALLAILAVTVFGTVKDNSQDARDRDIACANVQFSVRLVTYFQGRLDRVDERIGTAREQPIDREDRRRLLILLAASKGLGDDIGDACGPLPQLDKEP
jgi:hypothetical protein